MNKLEVGMYVRFKDKRGNTYIRRVVDGYKEHWYGCKVDKEANNVSYVSEKNILKFSFDILDLIEVGDYVNGYKVVEIDEYEPISAPKQKYLKVDCSKLFNALYIENIKSIVTKEQFESMEYKVGDSNES